MQLAIRRRTLFKRVNSLHVNFTSTRFYWRILIIINELVFPSAQLYLPPSHSDLHRSTYCDVLGLDNIRKHFELHTHSCTTSFLCALSPSTLFVRVERMSCIPRARYRPYCLHRKNSLMSCFSQFKKFRLHDG